MKRILLLSIFALNMAYTGANAELPEKEVVVQKGGVEVRYNLCKPCSTQQLQQFGPTYHITITNKSPHSIVVGPSIINAPLYTDYKEMARVIRNQMKPLGRFSSIASLIGTAGMWVFVYKYLLGDTVSHLIPFVAITMPQLPLFYALNKSIEPLQAYLMLRKPITIKPGKSVHKRFWLKNHDDKVSINFDAVEVLK